MKYQALWASMRAAWTAIEPHYEPVIERYVSQTGLDNRAWGLLLAAIAFEPETISPAQLLVRGPYTSPEKYLFRLRSLANGDYLEESGQGEFKLTERGTKATRQFIHDVRVAMAEADPLPKAKVIKLCETLDTLVAACLNAPQPPDTWSIRHSFRLMPEKDPPLPYVEQAFSCLSAYRDDAHLAAWQESSLSATELEVLTLLWRGQADSLDSLVEHLSSRGHTREVYSDALAVLRSRRFVAGSKSALQVLEAGKKFRDQVETDTERLFFAPWSVLQQTDRTETARILNQLKDGLKVS